MKVFLLPHLFGCKDWFRKSQRKISAPRYSLHGTQWDPLKYKRKFTQNFGERSNFHLEMKSSGGKKKTFYFPWDCCNWKTHKPWVKFFQARGKSGRAEQDIWTTALPLPFQSWPHESWCGFLCVNFAYGPISSLTAQVCCLWMLLFFSVKNLFLWHELWIFLYEVSQFPPEPYFPHYVYFSSFTGSSNLYCSAYTPWILSSVPLFLLSSLLNWDVCYHILTVKMPFSFASFSVFFFFFFAGTYYFFCFWMCLSFAL